MGGGVYAMRRHVQPYSDQFCRILKTAQFACMRMREPTIPLGRDPWIPASTHSLAAAVSPCMIGSRSPLVTEFLCALTRAVVRFYFLLVPVCTPQRGRPKRLQPEPRCRRCAEAPWRTLLGRQSPERGLCWSDPESPDSRRSAMPRASSACLIAVPPMEPFAWIRPASRPRRSVCPFQAVAVDLFRFGSRWQFVPRMCGLREKGVPRSSLRKRSSVRQSERSS